MFQEHMLQWMWLFLKRNRFKHWTSNSNRVITRYTCVTTSKSHAINFDFTTLASSSPFSWEDVAPAWRWSLQVRTWHHRLQRKCCRKGVSQNIQHNRILVPSKYPTEYHHCWQRNYVRYFFFWESFNFFCPPTAQNRAVGGLRMWRWYLAATVMRCARTQDCATCRYL